MVLIRERRGKRETQGGRSREDRGRGWSNLSTNLGTPRAARSDEKPAEKHGTESLLSLPGGTDPADTLISDSCPPEQ